MFLLFEYRPLVNNITLALLGRPPLADDTAAGFGVPRSLGSGGGDPLVLITMWQPRS
jgi:hypothetical protein